MALVDFIQRRARDNAIVHVHVMAAMTKGLKGQEMTEIGLLKRAGAIVDAGTGALSEVAGSPFAAGLDPQSVTVDPTGRFAYVANRQSADVSAYVIDAGTGALSEIAGSPFAGGIGYASIRPAGLPSWRAATPSRPTPLTPQMGRSPPSRPSRRGAVPTPVTVDPSGKFAYVANLGGNDISAYAIDPANGALASIGAAVPAGTRPTAIATTRTIR